MGTLMGSPAPAGPPMAESDDPLPRAPTPADPRGPSTQSCRPVPRVHTFGKGGQALRRDPYTPPAMQGWLHKQDSSGLRLWKRRWFVLVDLCLYYYRDNSEQRVRGGLPLPGYEIRVLPPAARAPQFLFTAEHPGMRTYCLAAETPEELHAWVCALRRGASPLPGSPRSLSLQTPQERQSAGPLSSSLPTHSPGWCFLCPRGEGLGHPLVPPPRRPPVPPLPLSKVPPAQEEPPARGGWSGTGDTQEGPRGPLDPEPAGRSPRKPLPTGSKPETPPERDSAANQTATSATASSDWLPVSAAPAGEGGRGRAREGAAGRPIRITLLQASF